MAEEEEMEPSRPRARPPRRVRQVPAEGDELFQEDQEAAPPSSLKRTNAEPSKARSGWEEDSAGAQMDSRLTSGGSMMTSISTEGDDDNGPRITDLQEIQEDDITRTVAEPPQLPRMAKLQALGDIEKEMNFHMPASVGVDLSLLQRALLPYHDAMVEKDEPWDFDSVFTEVTSEIQAEIERAQKSTKDKEEDDKKTSVTPQTAATSAALPSRPATASVRPPPLALPQTKVGGR